MTRVVSLYALFLHCKNIALTSEFLPRVRVHALHTRLSMLFNMQNGSLRVPRPTHHSFVDRSSEIMIFIENAMKISREKIHFSYSSIMQLQVAL
jgi:hypothetical protein